jgi:hypothetical protein
MRGSGRRRWRRLPAAAVAAACAWLLGGCGDDDASPVDVPDAADGDTAGEAVDADAAADADADGDAPDAPEDRGPEDVADGPEADVPPAEIAAALAAIPGLRATEVWSEEPGYRAFDLRFRQPVDHDDPSRGEFEQYLSLLHRSADAPVVLVTEGYVNWEPYTVVELTAMLEANQLVVEHRYFGDSRPVPTDWSRLTIRQAAADHHRVIEALGWIYGGAWLSTGASKGGMTAIYHRRFHPDDVDGTVPYVAPISFGAPDPRYVPFVEAGGDAACSARLRALQRELLTRRAPLLALLDEYAWSTGSTFDRMGGPEPTFESTVVGLPFSFWQYHGLAACPDVPGATASDRVLFEYLDAVAGFYWSADALLGMFEPYYYQAATQLGYPEVDHDALADLLRTDFTDLESGVLPEGVGPVWYDPAAMRDVADWVAGEGERLLFVYGEFDPWTAGAFELGAAVDSYRLVVPDGTHYANLAGLTAADRTTALDALRRWTGVSPHPPAGWRPAGLPRSPDLRRLSAARVRTFRVPGGDADPGAFERRP